MHEGPVGSTIRNQTAVRDRQHEDRIPGARHAELVRLTLRADQRLEPQRVIVVREREASGTVPDRPPRPLFHQRVEVHSA